MPRKKKEYPTHLIVDMDSMNLPESFVEVDMFAKPKPQAFMIPTLQPEFMTEDEVREIFHTLDDIHTRLSDAESRLLALKNLFKVKKSGDNLDRRYEVLFNNTEEHEADDLSTQILSSFVKDYGLDISSLSRDLRFANNLLEAKLMRGKPSYCEVDLLSTEKKEPVEC